MFACVVLGLASISGLAYAWNRTAERESHVQSIVGVDDSNESHQSSELSAIKRIDINSADEAKLDLLPGIGPALASRIVADRDEHGRFESVDDLQRVSGIGPKTVEKLQALVIVGD